MKWLLSLCLLLLASVASANTAAEFMGIDEPRTETPYTAFFASSEATAEEARVLPAGRFDLFTSLEPLIKFDTVGLEEPADLATEPTPEPTSQPDPTLLAVSSGACANGSCGPAAGRAYRSAGSGGGGFRLFRPRTWVRRNR